MIKSENFNLASTDDLHHMYAKSSELFDSLVKFEVIFNEGLGWVLDDLVIYRCKLRAELEMRDRVAT